MPNSSSAHSGQQDRELADDHAAAAAQISGQRQPDTGCAEHARTAAAT